MLLEDEAAGMAFPFDAKYFVDVQQDIAGHQYTQPESAESIVDLCPAKYGEEFLDCKAFPHLHPWGCLQSVDWITRGGYRHLQGRGLI